MIELPISHIDLQATVTEALHVLGWRHLHVRRSIGKGRKWTTATNVDGWPDLFCWHPVARRQLAIELKVPPDKLTPAQLWVLEDLSASGIETAVICPRDLGVLGELLAPRGGRMVGWGVDAFAPKKAT
jgi:hypothetical protein